MTLKKFLAVAAASTLVVSPVNTLAKTVEAKETTEVAQHRIYGDINDDGTVNAVDATRILQSYAKASIENDFQPNLVMDINWDKKVNSIDATCALMLYVDASMGRLSRYIDNKGVYVLVEEGQVLSEIASLEKMSLGKLLQLNPQISNQNLIYPKDKVYVKINPQFTGNTSTTTTTTTTTTPATTSTTTTTTTTTTITSTNTATTAVTTAATTTIPAIKYKKFVSVGLPWNVREKASTNSTILRKLYKGDIYEVLSENLGWEYININGTKGYVYVAEYPENFVNVDISTATTTNPTTTTSAVTTITTTTTKPISTTPVFKKHISKGTPHNIRESRNLQSKIIGKLYYNDTYQKIGEENGWEEIKINDIHGYIYTKDYSQNFVAANTKIDTDCISNAISKAEKNNPGIVIGVGVYTLNGNTIFEYNQNKDIAAGCTVKAPYECFVLEQCEKYGIDIDSYQLQYKEGMKNNGSGTLKLEPYGGWYSIRNLSDRTIKISDNTAYNVLLSKFGLADFCQFQRKISGETDGMQYDYPKVVQRKKEWLHIWNYLKTETKYANYFYNILNTAQYSYLTPNMRLYHNVLHKSGWQEEKNKPFVYPCAADCAILDERYLLVVLTHDYTTGKAHTGVLASIGASIEQALYF